MSEQEFEAALPMVRKMIMEQVGRKRHEAEDIIQEATIRAYKKAAQFASEEELLAYVGAEVKEKLRRYFARDRQRRRHLEGVAGILSGANDRLPGLDVETLVALEEATADFEPDLKEAVWDVLVRGKRVRETRLTKSTVQRAVALVKERIGSTK